jgi:hypothetical protein
MRAKFCSVFIGIIFTTSCNLGTPTPLIMNPENTPTPTVVHASPAASQNYIGLIYPPFPDNLEEGPGMMFLRQYLTKGGA